MMNKRLVLVLMMVMLLSFVACGCSSDPPVETTASGTESSEIVPPANVSKEGEPMTPEEIEYYMATIEANLIPERTGKGLDPGTLASFRKFAEEDDGQPFYMVNLIKENEEPQYPDSWQGKRAATVLEAKKLYGQACYPLMQKLGSYSITGVTITGPAVVNSGGDFEDWDQFYLIYYPNRKAFMELLSSDAYADAVVHKNAGDKETLLIPVSTGTLTAKEPFPEGEPMTAEEIEHYLATIEANLAEERTGKPLEPDSLKRFREFAESDDGKPFFMINLIREYDEPHYPDNWQGERASTVLEAKKLYSQACYPIMANTGSYSITGVTFAGPAVYNTGIDVEDWDQFYLIAYPNRRAFMELLASDAYADAIVHKNAGDKHTLLIPVTGGKLTVLG